MHGKNLITSVMNFILFIAFFAMSHISYANEVVAKRQFTFGYIEFPPFYYTDENGEAAGPLIDMAKALGDEVGFEVVPISLPPKRAVRLVAQGDVDLWFGLATNDRYNNNVYISRAPLDRLELRVYSTKPMGGFEDKTDLRGKSLVIQRGYSYGGLIHYISDVKNNIDVVRVGDIFQAFEVLKVRDLDYFLAYARPAGKALLRSPVEGLESRILSSLDVHITLHKKIVGADQLMKDLEAAQARLYPTIESIYGLEPK